MCHLLQGAYPDNLIKPVTPALLPPDHPTDWSIPYLSRLCLSPAIQLKSHKGKVLGSSSLVTQRPEAVPGNGKASMVHLLDARMKKAAGIIKCDTLLNKVKKINKSK